MLLHVVDNGIEITVHQNQITHKQIGKAKFSICIDFN